MAKILLAESSEATAILMVRQLESKGHEVVRVCNGDVALDMATRPGNAFDLVITAQKGLLGEMTGLELTQRIREILDHDVFPPILMFTGGDVSVPDVVLRKVDDSNILVTEAEYLIRRRPRTPREA